MKLKWNPSAIEDQRAIVAYCKKHNMTKFFN